jgi:hypothetical protein
MPYIIIIDKNGSIKETNIKEYREKELFKKANFKTSDGFTLQTNWEVVVDKKKHTIAVYGKKNGKAGQENKYEFPPPIDSVLLFGGCVLTKMDNNDNIQDLRISEWNMIYDKLMGGFEDLRSEEEEEEEEEIPEGMKISKDGYLCDDFIVDDDDEIDYDNLSLEEEEEEDEEKKEDIIKKDKKKVKNVKTTKTQTHPIMIDSENEYLDYQSELSEEEYL